MAARGAWYIKDNKLWYKQVDIDWDLGFDKEAKHEYIRRMLVALGDEVGRACDVTSASYIYNTRMLSPIFVMSAVMPEMSIEDWIHTNEIKMIPGTKDYNIACYHYMISLTEEHQRTIDMYDCFFDVFNNPTSKPHNSKNSQAFLIGIYKLLMSTGHLDILDDYMKFENIMTMLANI